MISGMLQFLSKLSRPSSKVKVKVDGYVMENVLSRLWMHVTP